MMKDNTAPEVSFTCEWLNLAWSLGECCPLYCKGDQERCRFKTVARDRDANGVSYQAYDMSASRRVRIASVSTTKIDV